MSRGRVVAAFLSLALVGAVGRADTPEADAGMGAAIAERYGASVVVIEEWPQPLE